LWPMMSTRLMLHAIQFVNGEASWCWQIHVPGY
jgi:hypothetical protein